MQTLSADQLKQMKQADEDFVLINVLSRDDFQQQHVPGSVSLPLDDADFLAKAQQLAGGKDRKIVVYCASKQCTASPTAAKWLEEAGFSNVYDFEGGTSEWQEHGYPLQQAA